ncbi:MAG: hypothetical protein ACYDCO_10730 [Armatimonadota bacterium]
MSAPHVGPRRWLPLLFGVFLIAFMLPASSQRQQQLSPARQALAAKDYAGYLQVAPAELAAAAARPQAAFEALLPAAIALEKTKGWDGETGKGIIALFAKTPDAARWLAACRLLVQGDANGLPKLFDGPPPSPYADEFYTSPIAQGVTPPILRRQPIAVYTLQLYAFRRDASLRRFLSTYPWEETNIASEGTDLYEETPKHFRFFYGDASLRFKSDPLYLMPFGEFTRVRYGLYESRGDARCDASMWKTRFGIAPQIVRVPLTESLVREAIWGELPGLFKR